MKRPPIALDPGRCDKCMSCVRECPQHAIRVGASFVFVDWSECDGCMRCTQSCETGAIAVRGGGAARRAEAAAEVAGDDPPAARAPAAAGPARVVAAGDSDAGDDAGGLPAAAPVTEGWQAWEVAAILVGLLVLFGARQLAMNSAWMRAVPLGAKPLMRSGVLVIYYAAQLGLLATLGILGGRDFGEALGLRRFPILRAAGWVVGLMVVTRIFAAGYLLTLRQFGLDMPEGPVTDLTRYFGRDAVGYALTVLLVVIVGPFFEEVVFRGVLLGYLQERTSGLLAIGISSVVFSAYHFNVWTFVPVAVMGVAAGWLAARYRSVWPAYALHLGYNAIAVVLTFAIASR